MPVQTYSNLFSSKSNRALTLHLLFSNGSMSRTDIADHLNISTPAVTAIANELLQCGLIAQCDAVSDSSHKTGRRKAPLSVNYDWKYVLAIDIHSYYVNIAVTNLRGDVIAETDSFAPDTDSSEKMVSIIAKECLSMLWRASIPESQLLGAGVTIIGPVNQIDGIAIHPYRLFDYPINLLELFEAEFSFPVAIESNVCSFLMSELLYTNIAIQNPNLLILKWGPGIGSALAIGGHIYKGRNWQSTELGHNRIVEKSARICNCGREGCLEPYISTDAIAEHIRHLISSNPEGVLAKTARIHGSPTRNNLNVFLDTKDPVLFDFLDNSAQLLANITNNALQTLAPDKLILMGSLFDRDDIVELFQKKLYRFSDDFPKDLCLRNQTISESKYIGATAIAVEQLLLK